MALIHVLHLTLCPFYDQPDPADMESNQISLKLAKLLLEKNRFGCVNDNKSRVKTIQALIIAPLISVICHSVSSHLHKHLMLFHISRHTLPASNFLLLFI